MMVALLLHAYAKGIQSSRQIGSQDSRSSSIIGSANLSAIDDGRKRARVDRRDTTPEDGVSSAGAEDGGVSGGRSATAGTDGLVPRPDRLGGDADRAAPSRPRTRPFSRVTATAPRRSPVALSHHADIVGSSSEQVSLRRLQML
jgi:hypothetical protein